MAAPQVAALQRTAGNRAVSSLLAAETPTVQRQPPYAPATMFDVPSGPPWDTPMAPAASTPAPQPTAGASRRPRDDVTALFGESDMHGPDIGTDDPAVMGYAAVGREYGRLDRWQRKQTRTTPDGVRVEARMAALLDRKHELERVAAAGRGRHKGDANVPKPKSLEPSWDPMRLSRDEVEQELDAIVNYLRTSPPAAERKKLNAARMLLEETLQIEASHDDEGVRQRDIITALQPTATGDYQQLDQILGTIEGIRPDPDHQGQWILSARGMAIPLADAEVQQLRAQVVQQLGRAAAESSELAQNAYFAFEERREKNNEHPIVHGLVKWRGSIEDLDELEIYGKEQNALALEHMVQKLAKSGQYRLALSKAYSLDAAASGLANEIAVWESDLVHNAGRWALALTILKEGLTMLATAGAAGLTTKLAQTAGYARAALTVGGSTTAAGALGGGGGSAINSAIGGEAPSLSDITHGMRVGAGTGLKIGAPAGVIGGMKSAVGVEEGVMTGMNVAKAVGVEAVGNTSVNVAGAVISGDSVTDELKGSLASAPISAIGGQAVTNIAGGSKAVTAAGSAVVGAGSSTAGALAQGKEGSDLVIAAGMGGVGGGFAPWLSDAHSVPDGSWPLPQGGGAPAAPQVRAETLTGTGIAPRPPAEAAAAPQVGAETLTGTGIAPRLPAEVAPVGAETIPGTGIAPRPPATPDVGAETIPGTGIAPRPPAASQAAPEASPVADVGAGTLPSDAGGVAVSEAPAQDVSGGTAADGLAGKAPESAAPAQADVPVGAATNLSIPEPASAPSADIAAADTGAPAPVPAASVDDTANAGPAAPAAGQGPTIRPPTAAQGGLLEKSRVPASLTPSPDPVYNYNDLVRNNMEIRQGRPLRDPGRDLPGGTEAAPPSVPTAAYPAAAENRFVRTGDKVGKGTTAAESFVVMDTQNGNRKSLFKPTSAEFLKDEQGAPREIERAVERGIVPGQQAPREVAGSRVANRLGLNAPAAELVKIGDQQGVLIEWRESNSLADLANADPTGFRELIGSEEFREAITTVDALDYLINNVDRGTNFGNYLYEFTPSGQLKLTPIDHAQSFTSTKDRADIEGFTRGLPEQYPPELATRLEELAANRAAFIEEIRPFVGDLAVEGFAHRLDIMINDMHSKRRGP